MDGLKKDDHSIHITPNHHPLKMDGLPKTCYGITLAAKWLYSAAFNHAPQPAATIFFYNCTPLKEEKKCRL